MSHITLLFDSTKAAQLAGERLDDELNLFVEIDPQAASVRVRNIGTDADDSVEVMTADLEGLIGFQL